MRKRKPSPTGLKDIRMFTVIEYYIPKVYFLFLARKFTG
jgi:hypothetical protein